MSPTRRRTRNAVLARSGPFSWQSAGPYPSCPKINKRQKAMAMSHEATPTEIRHPLLEGANQLMIEKVPSYGNKFLYSLGFLTMIAFVMLLVSGVLMTLFGPNWWLTSRLGGYTRSVHLWSCLLY